jgi:hypothetical protein
MHVRGVNLDEVVKIEPGAEGVRITFADGSKRFVGEADGGFEVLEGWKLDRRLMGGRNGG